MKRVLNVLFIILAAFVLSINAAGPRVSLTKKQVKALIANAKTPEDHLTLARYYDQEAESLLADAKDHDEMAAAYRKNPMTSGSKFVTNTVGHCEYFAKADRERADKMKEMAAEHRAMSEAIVK